MLEQGSNFNSTISLKERKTIIDLGIYSSQKMTAILRAASKTWHRMSEVLQPIQYKHILPSWGKGSICVSCADFM